MGVVLAGFCVREGLWGVTSLVRALGLQAVCYDRLQDLFHSAALDVEGLTRLWAVLMANLHPGLVTCNGQRVGILLALATTVPHVVWASFGSWLRTIGPGIVPSEAVVAIALRNILPHFLADTAPAPNLARFIQQRLDLDQTQAKRLAA